MWDVRRKEGGQKILKRKKYWDIFSQSIGNNIILHCDKVLWLQLVTLNERKKKSSNMSAKSKDSKFTVKYTVKSTEDPFDQMLNILSLYI